jgi:hypothetical protein
MKHFHIILNSKHIAVTVFALMKAADFSFSRISKNGLWPVQLLSKHMVFFCFNSLL